MLSSFDIFTLLLVDSGKAQDVYWRDGEAELLCKSLSSLRAKDLIDKDDFVTNPPTVTKSGSAFIAAMRSTNATKKAATKRKTKSTTASKRKR